MNNSKLVEPIYFIMKKKIPKFFIHFKAFFSIRKICYRNKMRRGETEFVKVRS